MEQVRQHLNKIGNIRRIRKLTWKKCDRVGLFEALFAPSRRSNATYATLLFIKGSHVWSFNAGR